MTSFAKKNMQTVMNNWNDAINHGSITADIGGKKRPLKMVMVTLTLPSVQKHSDKFIKREMLNHFLIDAKRKFNAERFVWKAEFQKNDNIHFHIIFDVYVDYLVLRSMWNKITNKHGYVDEFFAKNNHDNPNSTDVHALFNSKNAFKYMLKYMCKSESCRIENGKVWGCSDNLGKLHKATFHIDTNVDNLIFDAKNEKNAKIVYLDNATIIYCDVAKLMKSNHRAVYNDFKAFLKENWVNAMKV